MELLDRLRLPGIADGRALAFDDGEREAVDEHHDIRDDVLLRPEHFVLSGNDPLVTLRPIEVQEPDGVALASFAPILLQRDAVGERCIDFLVRLRETSRSDVRHRLHCLGNVGLGEPRIQLLEDLRET